MSNDRKNYNTTIRVKLIHSLRILATDQGRKMNDILEEAIEDILEKYGKKVIVNETSVNETSI